MIDQFASEFYEFAELQVCPLRRVYIFLPMEGAIHHEQAGMGHATAKARCG